MHNGKNVHELGRGGGRGEGGGQRSDETKRYGARTDNTANSASVTAPRGRPPDIRQETRCHRLRSTMRACCPEPTPTPSKRMRRCRKEPKLFRVPFSLVPFLFTQPWSNPTKQISFLNIRCRMKAWRKMKAHSVHSFFLASHFLFFLLSVDRPAAAALNRHAGRVPHGRQQPVPKSTHRRCGAENGTSAPARRSTRPASRSVWSASPDAPISHSRNVTIHEV